MSAPAAMSGGCLCGAIRFTAKPVKMEMDACHCSFCRRWTSGPFLSVRCGTSVAVADKAHLRFYRSSEWAERGFCGQCGTALFYRLSESGETAVAAGAFDDAERFAFTEEIFVDEKPANYTFANATHKMTGAEVFAAFQAKQGE